MEGQEHNKRKSSERLCSLLCKEKYGSFQRLAVVPYLVRDPGFFQVENRVYCLGLQRLLLFHLLISSSAAALKQELINIFKSSTWI